MVKCKNCIVFFMVISIGLLFMGRSAWSAQTLLLDPVGLSGYMTYLEIPYESVLIKIEDPGLKAAIYETLKLNKTKPLTITDALKVVNLDASNRNIRSLNGIESLINLEWLYLSNNHIGDISPLAGLTSLQVVLLDNNEIWDFSPLDNLPNLRWVLKKIETAYDYDYPYDDYYTDNYYTECTWCDREEDYDPYEYYYTDNYYTECTWCDREEDYDPYEYYYTECYGPDGKNVCGDKDVRYWTSNLPHNYASSILGQWYPKSHFYPGIPTYFSEYIDHLTPQEYKKPVAPHVVGPQEKITQKYNADLEEAQQDYNEQLEKLAKEKDDYEYYYNKYNEIYQEYMDEVTRITDEYYAQLYAL
ncbi:MAG: leucine-rich repeat domain-containing protein [bacterium]